MAVKKPYARPLDLRPLNSQTTRQKAIRGKLFQFPGALTHKHKRNKTWLLCWNPTVSLHTRASLQRQNSHHVGTSKGKDPDTNVYHTPNTKQLLSGQRAKNLSNWRIERAQLGFGFTFLSDSGATRVADNRPSLIGRLQAYGKQSDGCMAMGSNFWDDGSGGE
jgi:hypothetical protein